jgi:hypothetical protein
MTIDEVTTLASSTIADGDSVNAMKLARWIMENLAEAQPCGLEAPDVFLFRDGTPGVSFGEDTCSASEARAFARMLLTAADQGEELQRRTRR